MAAEVKPDDVTPILTPDLRCADRKTDKNITESLNGNKRILRSRFETDAGGRFVCYSL